MFRSVKQNKEAATFRISSAPFVVVPTFLNDQGPFSLIIDTGAAATIITEEIAKLIEIQNPVSKEAMGLGSGKLGVRLGEVSTISVGEAKAANSKVAVMENLPKCVGQGVVGYDFLRRFVVTIDYGRSLVSILPPEYHDNDEPLVGNPITLNLARADRPLILLDVLANGQYRYQFVLDTGASLTLVSPRVARETNIEEAQTDSLVGVGKVMQSSTGIMKSLAIGAAVLEDVDVAMSDVFLALSQVTGADVEGILGYNVLKEFRIVIDYPNRQLNMTRVDRRA